ncbi:glycosyltransferase [bacterium SCSIO 12741]|nr:glycosyltransferase [bacterium SCSIO 12741]
MMWMRWNRAMPKNIALHISQTPFKSEARLIKSAKVVEELGIVDKVMIVAFLEEGLEEHEKISDTIEVWRVKTWFRFSLNNMGIFHKVMLMVEWNLRILLSFLFKPVKYVNAHSVETLPLSCLFKWLKGSKLVYEPHELEAVKDPSPLLRKIYAKVERMLVKQSHAVLVVSGGIQEWYQKEYGLKKVYLAQNVPENPFDPNQKVASYRERFGIPENELVFVFQGGLIGARNIERYLRVFADFPKKHLVFMGNGFMEETIRPYLDKYAHIHHMGFVPVSDILAHSHTADVGLCLIEQKNLSYYYSAPNKLFEYLTAGTPVLASHFPGMEKVVVEQGIGWSADPHEDEALRTWLEQITPEEIQSKRDQLEKVRGQFNWSEEKKQIIELYHTIA